MARGTHSPIVDRSQEHSYLVANEDVRGVGQPYMIPADFREASNPLDPTRVLGSTTALAMASIPSPIVGKYIHLPDGTVATPGLAWASDTDTGLYRTTANEFNISCGGVRVGEFNSSGLQLASLGQTRVLYAGASGQIEGDADFTYDALTNIMVMTGRLHIGTATDTTNFGDAAIGLTGACRLVVEVSSQAIKFYDSSNNQDFRVDLTGDSYYNGSGNFGIGTASPDRKLDVESTSAQLRLTYSSGSIYSDLSTSSSGNLLLSPSNGKTLMDLDFPGTDVQFYIANADDTSTSSHARLYLLSSYFSGTGGDPVIQFHTDLFGSNTSWCIGLDNSDSDTFKLSKSTNLGTNDFFKVTTDGYTTHTISTATTTPIIDQIQSSTGDSATRWAIGSTISYIWGIDNSVAGDPFVLSTAASGSAVLGTGNILSITSGGLATWSRSDTATDPTHDLIQSSTGDIGVRWAIGTTASFIAGIDNSDSDSFKISYAGSGAAVLGTNDRFTILTGGNIGIGTTGPDRKLDILDASNPQLRLTHTDGSVYVDFQANSSGNLAITTSGTTIAMASAIEVNNIIYVSSVSSFPSASFDTYGLLLRTAGSGSAPFDQAGSLILRPRLSSTAGRGSIYLYSGATPNLALRVDENQNVICHNAALATTATNGFLYVPSCAGTPTGVPTTYTGRIPIVVDSTNHKLYFYSGGSWRDAGP